MSTTTPEELWLWLFSLLSLSLVLDPSITLTKSNKNENAISNSVVLRAIFFYQKANHSYVASHSKVGIWGRIRYSEIKTKFGGGMNQVVASICQHSYCLWWPLKNHSGKYRSKMQKQIQIYKYKHRMQVQNQNGGIWNQVVWPEYMSTQLLSDGHLSQGGK